MMVDLKVLHVGLHVLVLCTVTFVMTLTNHNIENGFISKKKDNWLI